MKHESKIQWKEYPQHKPQDAGYYMAIQDGIAGCGFYSLHCEGGGWVTFLNETEEGSHPEITHWAFFPDAVPVQSSDDTPDETPDEYLDRLVKEAAPAWDGVDPDKFMDEVRGRSAELEWKRGAPDMSGSYLLKIRKWRYTSFQHYEPDSEKWDYDEVLWHIGPIPPVPTDLE